MTSTKFVRLGLVVCTLLLLGGAAAARADLVPRDLFQPGDGLLTLDSATGLEWLDLTVTQGLSVEAVRFNHGGLSGGRFATREEVEALFVSAGVIDIHGTSLENAAGVALLLGSLGSTYTDPSGAVGALGMCDDGRLLNEWALKSKLRLGAQTEPLGTADVDMDVVSTHAEFSDTGIFIVRNAVVGAPDGPVMPAVRLRACPNPFNPSTVLEFTIPAAGWTELNVYDARGRCVRTLFAGFLPAGDHAVAWDGRSDGARTLPSGVYYARLWGVGFDDVKSVRLALVK